MDDLQTGHHGDDTEHGPVSPARLGARRLLLERAIVAAVAGDASDIEQLYTADVVGSGPGTSARCREEFAIEVEERRGALSQTDVTVAAHRPSG